MNIKLNVDQEATMVVLASLLRYLNFLEVTNNQLYEKFGLRPETLVKIGKGKGIARNADRYLSAMTLALKFQMEYAEEEGRTEDMQEIQQFLAVQMIALHSNFEI